MKVDFLIIEACLLLTIHKFSLHRKAEVQLLVVLGEDNLPAVVDKGGGNKIHLETGTNDIAPIFDLLSQETISPISMVVPLSLPDSHGQQIL